MAVYGDPVPQPDQAVRACRTALDVQRRIPALRPLWEAMGLASTQTLGPILDGLMRNTPDARRFIEQAAQQGVRAAVADRDGPFGDYGLAPEDERPDPAHVIRV